MTMGERLAKHNNGETSYTTVEQRKTSNSTEVE